MSSVSKWLSILPWLVVWWLVWRSTGTAASEVGQIPCSLKPGGKNLSFLGSGNQANLALFPLQGSTGTTPVFISAKRKGKGDDEEYENNQCSAKGKEGEGDKECSTTDATKECTAQAIAKEGGGGGGFGNVQFACSSQGNGERYCSTRGGEGHKCSSFGGPDAHCSAGTAPDPGKTCTSKQDKAYCSVVTPSGDKGQNSNCSTYDKNSKCSTFAEGAQCSVKKGSDNNDKCTALTGFGNPPEKGSCSAQDGKGQCSTLNGAPQEPGQDGKCYAKKPEGQP